MRTPDTEKSNGHAKPLKTTSTEEFVNEKGPQRGPLTMFVFRIAQKPR